MNEIKQWEKEHQAMLLPPKTAWPTIILLLFGFFTFFISSYAAIVYAMPIVLTIALNTIALFCLFTVLHDASHRSLSQNRYINEWLGTLSCYLLSPIGGIKLFRFIHMQHHRYTNGTREQDPDAWCGGGNKWTLPFRWFTLDLYYLYWYKDKWRSRPAKEKRELVIAISLTIIIFIIALLMGVFSWIVLLWLIPTRLTVLWLALGFDFLPHYPHDHSREKNPYLATNIRPTMSYLMTPILLYQNYHLAHHLYPSVPFYHYGKVWRAAQKRLEQAGARCYNWRNELITPPK